MAAFNFPSSPSEGQTYTDVASGAQYVFKSPVWMQVSAAQIKATALPRNRLVNPAMQLSQEIGLDTVASATGSYVADQWLYYFVASGMVPAVAVRRDTPTAHKDVGWFIRLASGSTIDTSIAAGDFLTVRQPIEGNRIADFAWGTAFAKPVVLRFLARSTLAGTFCVALRAPAGNPCFTKNCVITTPAVWQEFVIPIPGCTTGTWPTDNALGASLNFTIVAGSSYTVGVDNTWYTGGGNPLATPQISNWAATASQNLEFTDVGLYLDPDATGVAPKWEMPDEAEELAACQRYYIKGTTGTGSLIIAGYAPGASYSTYGHFSFPVMMRTIPSGTSYNFSTSNSSNPTFGVADGIAARWSITSVGVGTYYCVFSPILSARM